MPSPPSKNQTLTIAAKKTRKIRYYIFEVLLNFIVSIYFVPNILSRIARQVLVKQLDLYTSNYFRLTLSCTMLKNGHTYCVNAARF